MNEIEEGRKTTKK